ncbi:MAG: hypothetical protein JOZ69_05385 [Myxococcales bacterium]|nr:hypothetical protein [Myxococcales bacterium]
MNNPTVPPAALEPVVSSPAVQAKKAKKAKVWLSYDLGVTGDYDTLYAWLDEREAKECGDNLAVFDYEYVSDLLRELTADLEGSIMLAGRGRMYAIYGDEKGGHGKFIFGKRRPPPWAGHSAELDDSDE